MFRQHRASFEVEWAGRDHVGGHPVVVLVYRQRALVPSYSLPLPHEFGKPSPIHGGRLWLDAETGQLWRYTWELAWPHPASPDPLVMLRKSADYGVSRFGILAPSRIEWNWYTHFKHPTNGMPSFVECERATFTYNSFRRFEVHTEEKLKPPPAGR